MNRIASGIEVPAVGTGYTSIHNKGFTLYSLPCKALILL